MTSPRSASRWSRWLAIGLVSALSVGACAGPVASPSPTVSTTPAGSPGVGQSPSAPTGSLRVAFSELGTEKFDPRMDIGGAQLYWTEIYEQLLGIDSSGQPDSTGLAEAWQISTDGRSITFDLKQGVLWHDGEEFTAEDVVFSVDYYKTEDTLSPAKGFVTSNIASATADGDYRVTLGFNGSAALALAELSPAESFFFIVPKHYIDSNGIDALSAAPIGTGPWQFERQTLGEFIELSANTAYRDPARVPGFATLRVLGIREGSTRTAMLRAGDVDIAQIDADSIQVLGDQANIAIRTIARGASTMGVFLRSYDASKLNSQLDFRKALNLAIDREAIQEAIYPEGYATALPGSGLFATGAIGSDPGLAPYPYDPATARTLLASVYKGEPIKMYSYSVGGYDVEQPRINELLQGYWAEVGLDVQLEPTEYATFRPRVNTQDFPGTIELGTFAPAPRPSMVSQLRIYLNSHENGGTIWVYHNPEQARAWQTELLAITDPAELQTRLSQINRQLYDEYFAMPLYEINIPYGVNTDAVDPAWVPGDLRRVNAQLFLADPAP
jgi:peptide/nickel transport system substrate-binding protein